MDTEREKESTSAARRRIEHGFASRDPSTRSDAMRCAPDLRASVRWRAAGGGRLRRSLTCHGLREHIADDGERSSGQSLRHTAATEATAAAGEMSHRRCRSGGELLHALSPALLFADLAVPPLRPHLGLHGLRVELIQIRIPVLVDRHNANVCVRAGEGTGADLQGASDGCA